MIYILERKLKNGSPAVRGPHSNHLREGDRKMKTKRVTKSFRVDPTLWKKFRLKVVQDDATIEQLFDRMIKQYLRGGAK